MSNKILKKYLKLWLISDHSEHFRHHNALNTSDNPRLSPFPHSTTVQPLAQIKQILNLPGLGGATKSSSAGSLTGSSEPNIVVPESMCVAACFAASRGWVGASPTLQREKGALNMPYRGFIYRGSSRVRSCGYRQSPPERVAVRCDVARSSGGTRARASGEDWRRKSDR